MVSGLIPYFRLTDQSVANDLSIFKNLGIKFHFNKKVDSEIFNQIKKKFDFIYIGIGAQKSKRLGVPGENLDGIFDQLSFLSKMRQGEKINLNKNVAIIGGGLSAIDAARTAKRMIGKNGNVTMIYRRTKKEMPADAEEIHDLFEEDINLLELTTPVSFKKNSHEILITLIKMELKEPDQSGRPRPVMINGTEFELEFDNVITAIGQDLELDFIPGNKLILNNNTNEIQFENVFAGGDAVRGADSLINGMGDGKKIAKTISKKSGIIKNKNSELNEKKLSPVEFQKKQAYREFGVEYPVIDPKRRLTFELVHPALNDISAMKEAERCLYCNDICNTCVGVCPNFANLSFTSEEFELPIYRAIKNNGSVKIDVVDKFSIKQKNQILNIGDFCNECGNCTTFCPTSGDPYKIKPRFHLTEESFNMEESGYILIGNSLKYKSKKEIYALCETKDHFVFENRKLSAKFDKENLTVSEIIFKDSTIKNVDLRKATEMIYLLKSLKNFTIFA